MSMMIESTEELLALLKKMDLKVTSVEELQHLLATINANYNPDAARQKTGKLLGITVPGYMAGAAAFASFMLLGGGVSPFTVGALGVIWGSAAIVSTAAVISSAVLIGVRRGHPLPSSLSAQPPSRGEPLITNIIKELPT